MDHSYSLYLKNWASLSNLVIYHEIHEARTEKLKHFPSMSINIQLGVIHTTNQKKDKIYSIGLSMLCSWNVVATNKDIILTFYLHYISIYGYILPEPLMLLLPH